MSPPLCAAAMVSLWIALSACGPGDAHRRSGPGPRARFGVVGAGDASRLADRFRSRADGCFAEVFLESAGTAMTRRQAADAPRRSRALARLARELESCLTGRGYGGQVMIGAEVVHRWLAAGSCADFARLALRDRHCFALQGALDAAGFPIHPPAPRRSSALSARARPCLQPEPADGRGYYAAAHILVFFRGAYRAPARITRTQAAALQLAQRISALARRPGADFGALASRYSEGPTRKRGGRLGAFAPGRMVPAFSNAVRQLCIGEVSAPVLTRFGYHVILRMRP